MKSIGSIASLFVNDNNPLGFLMILSALFLFVGTYKHIQLKRYTQSGNRYQHYYRLFQPKREDDIVKVEVYTVYIIILLMYSSNLTF